MTETLVIRDSYLCELLLLERTV